MKSKLPIWALAAVLLGGSAGCATAAQNTAKDNMEKPLLKVGIISDIHGFDSPHDWGMHHLESAFQLFKSKNIDVLVMGGDLAEGPDLGTYRCYRELLNKHFAGQLPAEISCDGNHDAIKQGGKDAEQTFRQFCLGMKRPAINPYHCNFKGYDFIAFSLYKYQAWRDFAKLDKLLAQLTQAKLGQPVFVLTHEPPEKTLPDSYKRTNDSLRRILNKYPEAVSISGHTHWPVEDERSLWQGEFVAFQSATLSYGCMTESQAFNLAHGIVPFAREVNQALYMEVFADRLEIHRYNVHNSQELLPHKLWRIPLPYRPGRDQRRQQVQLPQFAPDAQILFRHDFGYMYLIFDRAATGDTAIYYDIEIARFDETKQQFEAPQKYRYVADFYRWPENRSEKQYFKLPNILKQGEKYRFRIYPVESFGGRGQYIEMIHRNLFTLIKDAKAVYPQE